MRVSDHTGKTFGRLTVVERAPNDGRPGARWLCHCQCGSTTIARGIDLTSYKIKSCGCIRRDDLAGKRFGRLLAVAPDERSVAGFTRWRCLCDCGNTTVVHTAALNDEHTRSCGCLLEESRRKVEHGHARAGRKTPTYYSWMDMHSRCRNRRHQDFADYGGRGITVCERWKKFEHFLADMGERPAGGTIERNNVHRGYEPKNCRWASRKDQSRNRRDTVRLTYQDETRPLWEWAEILRIKAGTLHMRLHRGWSVEKTIATRVSRNSESGCPKI